VSSPANKPGAGHRAKKRRKATAALQSIARSSAHIAQSQNDILEAQLHLAKLLDALHFLQVRKGSAAPEKQQDERRSRHQELEQRRRQAESAAGDYLAEKKEQRRRGESETATRPVEVAETAPAARWPHRRGPQLPSKINISADSTETTPARRAFNDSSCPFTRPGD
jgi:hypothetical protein